MRVIARRIIVRGQVQGVFYRGWTEETANSLGLSGWVRNRRDGSVEIVACGDEPAVTQLIERCHQGPPAAQVQKVEVEEMDEPCPSGFTTKPTL